MGRKRIPARMLRLHRISAVAREILKGPRSLMFPDDPDGRSLWLEPIVWLGRDYIEPASTAETLCIYRVPNCIEGASESPVVLRHAQWERPERSTVDAVDEWPRIHLGFSSVLKELIPIVDAQLRAVDSSISTFDFPVEGVHSGNLDVSAILANSGGCHRQYRRGTRFASIELSWQSAPDGTPVCRFDEEWVALFDLLASVPESVDLVISMVEKYDISPREYGAAVDREFGVPTT